MFRSSLKLITILIVSCLYFGCEGSRGEQGPVGPNGLTGQVGQNGVSDKQIRLCFPDFNYGGFGDTLPPKLHIIAFNKNNYVDVDSIVLAGAMCTTDTIAYCRVELFDATDNQVIANSLIQTNSSNFTWGYSKNILANLPTKDIDLSLRISSSKQGTVIVVATALLFLFRR